MTLNFVSVDSFLKMFANYELNGFREDIAGFFKGQYDDLTTCIVRLCRLEMQYHFTFFLVAISLAEVLAKRSVRQGISLDDLKANHINLEITDLFWPNVGKIRSAVKFRFLSIE